MKGEEVEIKIDIGVGIEILTLTQGPRLLSAIGKEEAEVAVLDTRREEDTMIKVKDMAAILGMVGMVERAEAAEM